MFPPPVGFDPLSEPFRNAPGAHSQVGPRLACFSDSSLADVVNVRITWSFKALIRSREGRMLQQAFLGDQILDVVRANPGCTLDELILSLPGVSWSEVFLEVDRMSRSGQLQLTQNSARMVTTLRVV